jgi:hypothetical protein
VSTWTLWLAARHVYAIALWVRTGTLLPALAGTVENDPLNPAACHSERAWPTVFRDPSGDGESLSTRFGMTSVEFWHVLVVIRTVGSPPPYWALLAVAVARKS